MTLASSAQATRSSALFEIVPAKSASGRITDVRLRYKERRGDTSIPLEAFIVDEAVSAYEASADMQFAGTIAEFGLLLREDAAGDASWNDALQLARTSRGADLDGTREEFVAIVAAARY